MLKRFDGSNWIDTSIHRRFDGSNWVDCSSIKRWDGTNWVDCMKALPSFISNLSYITIYRHTVNEDWGAGESYDTSSTDSNGKRYLSQYSETRDTDISTRLEILYRFRAVMKNGDMHELNDELLTLYNCNIYLSVYGYANDNNPSGPVSYCGGSVSFFKVGLRKQSSEVGAYRPQGSDITIRCNTYSQHGRYDYKGSTRIERINGHFVDLNDGKIYNFGDIVL